MSWHLREIAPVQRKGHRDPTVVQVPCRHEATATVAARPDQNRAGRWVVAGDGEVGQVAACVLHHLEELDAELVDHDAVDLAHLRGGDRRQIY